MIAIELTRIVKIGGPVTKRIHRIDGVISNDSGRCWISRGHMERLSFDNWRDYAAILEKTPSNCAYALGTLRDDINDAIKLVSLKNLKTAGAGCAARTTGTINYRARPSFALIDVDWKRAPDAVKRRVDEFGGVIGALEAICLGLSDVGYILRQSTSAGIYDTETGERYNNSSGMHLYVLVRDGTDIRRFLYCLHERAWLLGLGWHEAGAAGQLLERALVDRSVCDPSRIVFEADAECAAPLAQERREAVVHDGDCLDTTAIVIGNDEQARVNALKAASKQTLKPECEVLRQAYIDAHVEKKAVDGVNHETARGMVEAMVYKRVLYPPAVLVFDDPEIGEISVKDILERPDKFDGETLGDPVDPAYGRCKAKVYVQPGFVKIHSCAHGLDIWYSLLYDSVSVEAGVIAAPATEAARVFVRLALIADLDRAEMKRLAKLAGGRSGAGVRVVESMLKDAFAAQRQSAAQDRRERNAATSIKARLPAPQSDSEAGPVMAEWDEVLCKVNTPEPPMRDAEGCPIEIQCRETAGLHELTAQGSNDEEDEKSRLPSPKNYLLTKHDKFSLEIEIGDHITFVQETEDGERHVAPPDKFLMHYLKYSRSKLPHVHAVVTMPIVLGDGTLLSCNGLDSKRRAVFRVDPALLEFIPKPEVRTEDEVAKAYKYLTDEWLVDVATDADGKCVIIAFTLSIIERVLFPERPVFFVTAGQRGGGKTTVLKMATLAALGVNPPAAAWTNDSEERKKALFAYLREGLPVVIWDNIARGSTIGCPHIERACTSETYQDRLLGVSQTPTAPAYTIMAFTGNNIRPKSDHASRSLEVRLTADRPDPENRPFVHADPIGWTLDHRGEILHALYTILLGNPQLDPNCRREAETRFKPWWRLVGSAVEHAAETVGQIVSFKGMFKRVEDNDDEAAARGEVLQALQAVKWPKKQPKRGDGFEFTARDLLAHLDLESDLGRFCTPRNAKAASAASVSRSLRSIIDAPVLIAAGMLTLRSRRDTHSNVCVFWVEFKVKLL